MLGIDKYFIDSFMAAVHNIKHTAFSDNFLTQSSQFTNCKVRRKTKFGANMFQQNQMNTRSAHTC